MFGLAFTLAYTTDRLVGCLLIRIMRDFEAFAKLLFNDVFERLRSHFHIDGQLSWESIGSFPINLEIFFERLVNRVVRCLDNAVWVVFHEICDTLVLITEDDPPC